MTEHVSSRMQVVRKQDKEPRLKDFIRKELSRTADRGLSRGGLRCLVVARSVDSPVMRALSSFQGELEDRGVELRAIVTASEAGDAAQDASTAQWLNADNARIARNGRLIDAHEFLVLGDEMSWIGDCMRRDPVKRDAFEAYRDGDSTAAALAARSFERLWSLSEALPRKKIRTAKVETPVSEASAGNLADTSEVLAPAVQETVQAPVPGATRH